MIKVVAGVDLGGTHTAIGIVDKNMNFYGEESFPTTDYKTFEAWADKLTEVINRLCQKADVELIGFGLGAPNANHFTRSINNTANLQQWKTSENNGIYNIATTFKTRLGEHIEIALDNDANAAAAGEKIYGGAKNMKDFIVITLGTGLGSGIFVNDQLVYGYSGTAGELGHVIVKRNDRPCGCGRAGCLETYASATGICRTVNMLIETEPELGKDSILRKIAKEENGIKKSKVIHEAAQKGDPLALKAFDITGKVLGEALADFTAFTSPEAFFLFGGLANSREYILNPTLRYMEESLCFPFAGKVKVLLSDLLDKNAAILGSAALAWDSLDKK